VAAAFEAGAAAPGCARLSFDYLGRHSQGGRPAGLPRGCNDQRCDVLASPSLPYRPSRRRMRSDRLSGGSTSTTRGGCLPRHRSRPVALDSLSIRPLEASSWLTPSTSPCASPPTCDHARCWARRVWKPSGPQQLPRLQYAASGGGRPAAGRHQPVKPQRLVSRVLCPHRPGAGIHSPARPARFHTTLRTVGRTSPATGASPPGRRTASGLRSPTPSADPPCHHRAGPRRVRVPGPECSAASRAYISAAVWTRLADDLIASVESLTMGGSAQTGRLHVRGHRRPGVSPITPTRSSGARPLQTALSG